VDRLDSPPDIEAHADGPAEHVISARRPALSRRPPRRWLGVRSAWRGREHKVADYPCSPPPRGCPRTPRSTHNWLLDSAHWNHTKLRFPCIENTPPRPWPSTHQTLGSALVSYLVPTWWGRWWGRWWPLVVTEGSLREDCSPGWPHRAGVTGRWDYRVWWRTGRARWRE